MPDHQKRFELFGVWCLIDPHPLKWRDLDDALWHRCGRTGGRAPLRPFCAVCCVAKFVRYWGAASTDRRNTSVKSLCWGFKLQGLAWSLVELTRHFVEMSLRVHRQVGALRKVLPQ